MKQILTILASALVINVYAQSIDAADTMLKTTVTTVLSTLKNKDLTTQQRRDKLIEVFDRAFDFKLMAKLSLGGRHWGKVNSEKQQIFTDLFIERLKESYMDKLELYSDETVSFEDPIKKSRKLQIPSFLNSQGEKISMLYKMYNNEGKWYIYDVEVQGVSIISTYRSQYNQVLQKGSFDDLLETMKPKADSESGTPEN